MKVVWTETSLQRLLEIEDYIAVDDPVSAVAFTEKLIRRTDILSELPRAGRLVPEASGSELRELIEGNYRIVYRLLETTIEILTVFEAHKRFCVEGKSSEK